MVYANVWRRTFPRPNPSKLFVSERPVSTTNSPTACRWVAHGLCAVRRCAVRRYSSATRLCGASGTG
eukprot:3920024-Prymnesium_polylepis.1